MVAIALSQRKIIRFYAKHSHTNEQSFPCASHYKRLVCNYQAGKDKKVVGGSCWWLVLVVGAGGWC